MKIDLKNKNILITGASRGIGAGLAEHLGESGARLALHYNSNKEEAEKLAHKIGGDAFTIQSDLGNQEGLPSFFSSVLDRMGKVNVLINNAGLAIKSPIDLPDQQWVDHFHKTLQVNLMASAFLCKKAIEHFKENGGGIIINISSRAAHRGDTGDFMAYAASKGGLSSLTKSIAREYGRYGITAFNIAPGFVMTDMAAQFLEEYGEDYLISDIALNRITKPSDLGPLIVLLASGLAEHATGTTIDINAGSYIR